MRYHREIQKLLRLLGVDNCYLGYHYTTYGVQKIIEDETTLILISKWLYPEIARKYHTSLYCVERDIRTVVDVIWVHGDTKLLQELAGRELKKKPRNREFLSIIANHLKNLYEA